MECAACQSTTREDAKFCDACGTPVSVACSGSVSRCAGLLVIAYRDGYALALCEG